MHLIGNIKLLLRKYFERLYIKYEKRVSFSVTQFLGGWTTITDAEEW